MIENAFAMAGPQGQSAPGNPLAPLFLLAVMFLILYVLMIRPQQKKLKAHETFIKSLERGDKVITDSGIHGEIVGLTDTVATLEIADGIRIKMDRSRIAGKRGQKEEA